MLKRSDMKSIYSSHINNQEKREWGKNAGYSNYEGLYKFLSRKSKSHEVCSLKIIEGLRKTVGEYRFQKLTKSKFNYSNYNKKRLVDRIFNDNSDDAVRFEIFQSLAKELDFEVSEYFRLETEITDLLQKLPDSEELIEKIRVANEDIMNIVVLRNFTIPLVREEFHHN